MTATTTLLDRIKQRIDELEPQMIEQRRDFHMYPELGFEEERTSRIVENHLRSLEGMVVRRCTRTGLVAVLNAEKPGPTVLLRADMDALPVQEENDLAYRSRVDGVMHACAHDAHTAMLMTAATIFSELREEIPGKVKFVFQPNEEVGGAEDMVEEGVLDDPAVDAAFAIHLWTPLPSGVIGVKAGGVMATMDVFKIIVTGLGGHTGYPDSAIDPVITAAEIIQSAQTIQTREINLMKPTAIMFAKIQGGTKNNIIPGSVELEGSMRYLYDGGPGSSENPGQRLERIVRGLCEAHRNQYELEIERENTAVINDPAMAQVAHWAALATLGGDQSKVVEHASMAGEDFAAFALRVPSCFYFVGTGNPEKRSDYPHHNARFNIDEDTMRTGVEMHLRTVFEYFEYRKRR